MIPIYQVDAFTDQLFKGNPAAVCPLDQWLPDATLQAIAAENNLSETAFFLPASSGLYPLRWFTPTAEVDLCGHATLATAHVLFHHLRPDTDHIRFQTRSGILPVIQTAPGQYQMDFPLDQTEPRPPLPQHPTALETWKGKDDYLLILQDQSAVETYQPDFDFIASLPSRGLIISAPGNETDFVCRCFYPQVGVPEDPVTGSSFTTQAPYWAKKLQQNTLSAIQLSSRRGTVTCQLQNDRLLLTGHATTYLVGQINV
jgi:predicted PhzF superfamily epimerase YddE/YHI9